MSRSSTSLPPTRVTTASYPAAILTFFCPFKAHRSFFIGKHKCVFCEHVVLMFCKAVVQPKFGRGTFLAFGLGNISHQRRTIWRPVSKSKVVPWFLRSRHLVPTWHDNPKDIGKEMFFRFCPVFSNYANKGEKTGHTFGKCFLLFLANFSLASIPSWNTQPKKPNLLSMNYILFPVLWLADWPNWPIELTCSCFPINKAGSISKITVNWIQIYSPHQGQVVSIHLHRKPKQGNTTGQLFRHWFFDLKKKKVNANH